MQQKYYISNIKYGIIVVMLIISKEVFQYIMLKLNLYKKVILCRKIIITLVN